MVNGERDELNRQVFTARAEREDMVSLAERRQAELTRAGAEIRSLTEEVARAQTAKVSLAGGQYSVLSSDCYHLQTEALVRIDEVESREAQLEHKEKRLAEEKTFYEQQMKQLETELEKQREELLASKREAGHKLAGLSQVSYSLDSSRCC